MSLTLEGEEAAVTRREESLDLGGAVEQGLHLGLVVVVDVQKAGSRGLVTLRHRLSCDQPTSDRRGETGRGCA